MDMRSLPGPSSDHPTRSGELVTAIRASATLAAVLPILSTGAFAETVPGGAPAPGAPHLIITPDLGQIFTFLFVTLGPIKVIGPFLRLTARADDALRRQLALRASYLSAIAALVAATLGSHLLTEWNISIPALMIAGSIVLFLVALRTVIEQYEPAPADHTPPVEPTLAMAFSPLAFPTIITPYGVAVLIVFLAMAQGLADDLRIFGVLAVILLLDLLAMLYARQIVKTIGMTTLHLLNAVLGIMQVALAVNFIINAFIRLGAIPLPAS